MRGKLDNEPTRLQQLFGTEVVKFRIKAFVPADAAHSSFTALSYRNAIEPPSPDGIGALCPRTTATYALTFDPAINSKNGANTIYFLFL